MAAWLPIVLLAVTAASPAPAHPAPRASTLTWMLSGFEAIMTRNDADHDGRLSRAEWGAMVGRAFPAKPRARRDAHYYQVRQRALREFDVENVNKDKYLTLAELLRAPMATFVCMDTNRDDTISKDEERAGETACAAPEAKTRR